MQIVKIHFYSIKHAMFMLSDTYKNIKNYVIEKYYMYVKPRLFLGSTRAFCVKYFIEARHTIPGILS